jgi:uncharacterized protein (TIGR02118 family)
MTKVIFVLHRRPDLTLEQFTTEWSGERHARLVTRMPGLRRWVQNRSVPQQPGGGAPPYDGIGELWFDSVEAVATALQSAEWEAVMEDGMSFGDLQRSQMLLVEEAEINLV